LHDRAANSTYTLTALGYFVTDLTLNYTRPKYELGLAVENLFNVQWNESQFEYVSRLGNENRPVDEVSYTPGVPFFCKIEVGDLLLRSVKSVLIFVA
jgi:outer membrane receptor protein involved in Fe transport